VEDELRTTPVTLWLVGALLLVPGAVRGQDNWQIGLAPGFSSGRYGTGTRTEVLHTPITARRLFTDADLSFVFPLTCVWGSAGVTVVNGTPVRTERLPSAGDPAPARGGTAPARGTSAPPARTTETVPSASSDAAAPATSACGMGDIVVRGRYYLVDEGTWLPTIAFRGHLKAPTADADRGLGTGRPDEGVGVEISRTFGRGFMAMADGGYTFIGRPEGVDYRNTWRYDVGVGQNVGSDAVNLSVFFAESRAIVEGLANPRDILVALEVRGASGWRIQIAGEKGLSDGAPDHGVVFGAARRF
jgi:hypothetical protein